MGSSLIGLPINGLRLRLNLVIKFKPPSLSFSFYTSHCTNIASSRNMQTKMLSWKEYPISITLHVKEMNSRWVSECQNGRDSM